MADDKTLNERDTKLVQWLNEAYAKEAELEADLAAHIALTQKMPYKKRLRAHLTETKDHKKRVAARIKALGGGKPTPGPQIPGVPAAFGEVAGKAVAAVKGQVGTARAAVTQQSETHMRNAQEELREEHVEIIYTRLEALATAVGDKETAQLAKDIRRDEERMAKFLDAELKRLVKEVVRADVPAAQRTTARRRSTRARTASSSSRSRSTSSRSTSASSRSTSARSSRASRSGSGSARSRGGSRS
jgi:ferritin-like metal-binding protein YciE